MSLNNALYNAFNEAISVVYRLRTPIKSTAIPRLTTKIPTQRSRLDNSLLRTVVNSLELCLGNRQHRSTTAFSAPVSLLACCLLPSSFVRSFGRSFGRSFKQEDARSHSRRLTHSPRLSRLWTTPHSRGPTHPPTKTHEHPLTRSWRLMEEGRRTKKDARTYDDPDSLTKTHSRRLTHEDSLTKTHSRRLTKSDTRTLTHPVGSESTRVAVRTPLAKHAHTQHAYVCEAHTHTLCSEQPARGVKLTKKVANMNAQPLVAGCTFLCVELACV